MNLQQDESHGGEVIRLSVMSFCQDLLYFLFGFVSGLVVLLFDP